MFGLFRLILAVLVVVSHMGLSAYGGPGSSAVVCFYAISGYAMSALIGTSYPNMPADAGRFYLERFLRLAPQYYFYIAVFAFTVLVLNWRADQPGSPDVVNIFANLTIIPLSFFMYSQSIFGFMLDPPTWSIGLELSFYLLVPLLLLSRRLLVGLTWIAFVVFLLATLNKISIDYAYRLLPGTLVFFVLGIAVHRRLWDVYWVITGFFLVDAAVLLIRGKFTFGLNASILFGAFAACVALPLLARLKRRRWDEELGNISYGCYLAHWLFVSALASYRGQPWAIAIAVAGGLLAGWISYILIEKPTIVWRRSFRARKAQRAYASASAERAETRVMVGRPELSHHLISEHGRLLSGPIERRQPI